MPWKAAVGLSASDAEVTTHRLRTEKKSMWFLLYVMRRAELNLKSKQSDIVGHGKLMVKLQRTDHSYSHEVKKKPFNGRYTIAGYVKSSEGFHFC
ncbi:hypothetical protein Y1Q_0004750 [Alligator mississippiensis]|uniref:Uncharacterized protein n=1 Tax=Alligator mississippiensis TaxID=8496 RepID=A0A151NLE3_ALLMI|nr:hypothetical protein Y1Q_0004750 [Alligator mississippiensis]